MLRTIWLIAFAASASGCTTLGGSVPTPKGKFCSYHESTNKSLCVDIESGSRLSPVPEGQMDKWITMPPATWNSIQNTLDKLRNRVQMVEADIMLEDPEIAFLAAEGQEVLTLSSDLEKFQKHTKRLYRKTLEQR